MQPLNSSDNITCEYCLGPMGGCSIFREWRRLPYLRLQEVSYLIKSTTLWVLIRTKRGGEIGTNNLSMQGQTDYDLGRKLECTSVCNTEYISLSMEVHTFTQLLRMLLVTIPIVAIHNPETCPEMVSSQLFPFIYKIENKICLRKAFPEVLTVLCPTMSLWCPH